MLTEWQACIGVMRSKHGKKQHTYNVKMYKAILKIEREGNIQCEMHSKQEQQRHAGRDKERKRKRLRSIYQDRRGKRHTKKH